MGVRGIGMNTHTPWPCPASPQGPAARPAPSPPPTAYSSVCPPSGRTRKRSARIWAIREDEHSYAYCIPRTRHAETRACTSGARTAPQYQIYIYRRVVSVLVPLERECVAAHLARYDNSDGRRDVNFREGSINPALVDVNSGDGPEWWQFVGYHLYPTAGLCFK